MDALYIVVPLVLAIVLMAMIRRTKTLENQGFRFSQYWIPTLHKLCTGVILTLIVSVGFVAYPHFSAVSFLMLVIILSIIALITIYFRFDAFPGIL